MRPFYALIAAMSASPRAFPTIGLVGRYATPGIAEPLGRLAQFLVRRGHRVIIDAETAMFTPLPGYPTAPAADFGRKVALAIVIAATGRCSPSPASSRPLACR